MFYPVESLRRGGRFYFCWVADSWPLRFATITHRQLWSHDIRKICDDLMEVMINESGRPTNRFSLRLSSQLLRGLARLYQKKVNILMSDLCMINANVTKQINKRFNIPEVSEVHRTSRPRAQVTEQLPQITLPEEPENEPKIEEIISYLAVCRTIEEQHYKLMTSQTYLTLNSGNVVSNNQEITLREAAIPEFQLPPNDGFGEENPSAALQLVFDRTLELMMQPTEPSHRSATDALDVTEPSHDSRLDRSRLAPDRLMERISDHHAFFKPNGDEIIPGGEFEKDIPIPEIPDDPIPELSKTYLPEEQLPLEPEIVEKEKPTRPTRVAKPAVPEPEEIELEELEEPQAKRRRLRKLIIDKRTKLSGDFLRARIDDPYVETRCKDSSDDIIEIRVPCEYYMRRPCRAGARIYSNLSLEITRLFMRNLGVMPRSPRTEKEFQEQMLHCPQRRPTRSTLGRIEEIDEQVPEKPQQEVATNQPENQTLPGISSLHDINVSNVELEVQREVDSTQILTRLSRKRKTADDVSTPKKKRSVGFMAFKESQQNQQFAAEQAVPIIEPDDEALQLDKENVPQNMQDPARNVVCPTKEVESVTAMLQQAGLADIQTNQPEVENAQRNSSRQHATEGTETPLGSLDRTMVSLGDSEKTTDSKRFIRDQWGAEGCMIKILKFIRKGLKPVTVRRLVSEGPVIPGYKSIIAARCFTSMLKLKHHGFIVIRKCPDTLEISDVELGPKFDQKVVH